VIELALATVETDLDGALELGGRALAWTEMHGRALLASASFTAQALVLGSLQREDTLRARSPARFDGRVARRSSTGTEAQLDGAVLYHALTLPRVDALFSDASARTLLNRNLRALLRGYAAAGVPFRYFGTEVLAVLGHPVALVGYDQTASGAVLIEVLIGLENPCVVRPALKREPPAALYPLLRRSPPAHDLLLTAVAGIVDRLGATPSDVAALLPSASATANCQLPTANCPAPGTAAIPLGVVEAVVAPAVRITGDLLVGSAALRSFEERAAETLARGETPTSDLLKVFDGAAIDGARPPDLLQALLQASRPGGGGS
jgi:hypothetical protein